MNWTYSFESHIHAFTHSLWSFSWNLHFTYTKSVHCHSSLHSLHMYMLSFWYRKTKTTNKKSTLAMKPEHIDGSAVVILASTFLPHSSGEGTLMPKHQHHWCWDIICWNKVGAAESSKCFCFIASTSPAFCLSYKHIFCSLSMIATADKTFW